MVGVAARKESSPLIFRPANESRYQRKRLLLATAALLALCSVLYAGWHAQPTELISTAGGAGPTPDDNSIEAVDETHGQKLQPGEVQ
jgi:hypothetical protein